MSKSFKRKLTSWILRKETTSYWWKLRTNAKKSNTLRGLFNQYKYQKYIRKYNSFIPLSVEFEDIPTFPHGLSGVFISTGAKIGKRCVIFHQVTIGSNTLKESRGFGAPTIGDNVYIGCGAKIIGNVKIGNNVRIGANCVVTNDVEDNTTVVLGKNRYIKKEILQNNEFISYGKI